MVVGLARTSDCTRLLVITLTLHAVDLVVSRVYRIDYRMYPRRHERKKNDALYGCAPTDSRFISNKNTRASIRCCRSTCSTRNYDIFRFPFDLFIRLAVFTNSFVLQTIHRTYLCTRDVIESRDP